MENLKQYFILVLLMSSVFCYGKKNVPIKVGYLNVPFAHVHQNPRIYSTSLTAISCGHPLNIYAEKKKGWYFIKVGLYKGMLKKLRYLLERRGVFKISIQDFSIIL